MAIYRRYYLAFIHHNGSVIKRINILGETVLWAEVFRDLHLADGLPENCVDIIIENPND